MTTNQRKGETVNDPKSSLDGTGQLYAALAEAQAIMPNAVLNKINPHYKSRYADLAAIRDATLPALTKHGLSIVQYTAIDESGNLLLHTRLAHKSGHWVEGIYPLPIALDKPQAMGSALTYARRYEWASICGIAAEEDDDANAAMGAVNNGKLKRPMPVEDDVPLVAEDGLELVTAEQRDELVALADEYGIDKAAYCKRYNIRSIADIARVDFPKAKSAMLAKKKVQGNA